MTSVYVASCERYDPEVIAGHVRAASAALGVPPSAGEVLLQPSLPWTHPRYAPDAHTAPAVLEGVARACQGAAVSIGAQSLPGFPTRYSFGRAGYDGLARRIDARLLAFDEDHHRDTPSPGTGASFPLPATWLDASFRVAVHMARTLRRDAEAIEHPEEAAAFGEIDKATIEWQPQNLVRKIHLRGKTEPKRRAEI